MSDLETEIHRTLEVLHPEPALMEMRVLIPGTKSTGRIYTKSHDVIVNEVIRLENDGVHPYQYYTVINEINPELEDRITDSVLWGKVATTKGADIVRRRYLPIDTDPNLPKGTSATDEEKQRTKEVAYRVRNYLTAHGFPDAIIGDSGNGYWPIYCVNMPNDAHTRELHRKLIQHIDKAIEHEGVKFDSLIDPNRIVKLFGTMARKGPALPNRPHRQSRLEHVPEPLELLTLETLTALVGDVTIQERPTLTRSIEEAFDLQGWLDEHGIDCAFKEDVEGSRYILDVCPFNTDHSRGEAYLIQFHNGAIAFNCLHDTCRGMPGDKAWQELRATYEPNYAERLEENTTRVAFDGTILRQVPNDADAEEPKYVTSHKYRIKNGCITIDQMRRIPGKKNDDGTREKPTYEPENVALCNFRAWITSAIERDDGRNELVIDGIRDDGLKLPTIRESTAEFHSMKWISKWESRATIWPGHFHKDHVCAAIEILSNEHGYPTKRVYTHIGWEKIGDEWKYLHIGGAIGADGLDDNVEVIGLENNLRHFVLPTPPNREQLLTDIKDYLGLLDDANMAKIPLWLPYFDVAKTFRSLLNEVIEITSSTFLLGHTGWRKTPYNAIWQGHYGMGFSETALPAYWSNTAMTNERVLNACKDALCEIDDYRPIGDKHKVASYSTSADFLVRGQSQGGSRGRLTSNADFAKSFPSRAMLSVSGEDLPLGESLLARMLIRNIDEKDIDKAWLTKAQKQHNDGLHVRITSAYAQWLAPKIDDLKASNKLGILRDAARDDYAAMLNNPHERVYSSLADLSISWKMLMDFFIDVGAIDEEQRVFYTNFFVDVMLEVGTDQAKYIRAATPERQFLEGVAALLASGKAYLSDFKSGQVPNHVKPDMMGWREGREQVVMKEGHNTEIVQLWIPNGTKIGWIDAKPSGQRTIADDDIEGTVYLLPEIAYKEFYKLMSDQGLTFSFSRGTLYRMLQAKGLAVTDRDGSGRGRQTTIQGSNIRTVQIAAPIILKAGGEENDEPME